MQVEIYGAVKMRVHSNISSDPKRPKYARLEVQYEDMELLQLLDKNAGAYGRHWVYDGDQGFEESNIHITVKMDDGAKEEITFVGRKGLNEAIEFLRNKGFKARSPDRQVVIR